MRAQLQAGIDLVPPLLHAHLQKLWGACEDAMLAAGV